MVSGTKVILLAEDSPTQAVALKSSLESRGYRVHVAFDGVRALRLAEDIRPDLVISDVLMPRMDGFHLCRRLRTDPALGHIPFVLRSAVYGTEEDRAFARAVGVDAYVEKGAGALDVAEVCKALLEGGAPARGRSLIDDDVFQETYNERVLDRLLEEVARVDHASETLAATFEATLQSLVAALDLRDAETEAHSWRVTDYALRIGHEMGEEDLDREALRRGSLLHDIGKIAVPDQILRKPGSLDEEEWAVMRTHSALGYAMVAGLELFRPASELILSHHERWDGGGYPQGLEGESIPLIARIFSVSDAIDAITSDRPYRRARDFEVALAVVRHCSGTQFDPSVAETALRVPVREWEERRRSVEDAVKLRRAEKERAIVGRTGMES